MVTNLNELSIEIHQGQALSRPPCDHSMQSGEIAIFFRNLEVELIRLIRGADLVVGCVAWLTSEEILAAMAEVRHGVSIVVQKEDFLRPDVDQWPGWRRTLQEQYRSLPRPPERHLFRGLVGNLSCASDPTIEPVRCVGNHNRDKQPAFPRMHNKFLVFCKTNGPEEQPDEDWGSFWDLPLLPKAVWTGSFNLTRNATLSLENAVVIRNEEIANAYFDEWQQILALSEPLDWLTDWCEPEWRIGT